MFDSRQFVCLRALLDSFNPEDNFPDAWESGQHPRTLAPSR